MVTYLYTLGYSNQSMHCLSAKGSQSVHQSVTLSHTAALPPNEGSNLGLWPRTLEKLLYVSMRLSLLAGKRRLDLAGKRNFRRFSTWSAKQMQKNGTNHGNCSKKAYLLFVSWAKLSPCEF